MNSIINSTAIISTTTNLQLYPTPDTYQLTPYASYAALAFVLVFGLFIVVARLFIRVEGQQSDLLLFNKSPQKQLLLLVSKQLYNNTAAQNNIASAIANGLMDPPPNYDPPKVHSTATGNVIRTSLNDNKPFDSKSTATSTTTLNSVVNKFDSLESIEPAGPKGGKRSKW